MWLPFTHLITIIVLCACRRAIELAETKEKHARKDPESSESADAIMPGNQQQISIRDISQVIALAHASESANKENSLPLQQKIVACTLLCLTESGRKEPSIGHLYDTYSRICSVHKLKQEGESEFVGFVSMLETRGMLTMKKLKEAPRFRKVCLKINGTELAHSLNDRVMTSILEAGLPHC